MSILFYDPLTPKPYDLSTPEQAGLGGTEATVLRIASALKTHYSITLAQHCRRKSAEFFEAGLHYCSFETVKTLDPKIIIILRDYKSLEPLAKQFPKAKIYLWLHNMPSTGLYRAKNTILNYNIELLAVSHFHQKAIERRLKGPWTHRLLKPTLNNPRVRVLYNPIDDQLEPDDTPILPQQLLFMSAPEKGLAETLKHFEALKQIYPEYELLIANPGYSEQSLLLPQGARLLGALPRAALVNELRRSFCVFYPQTQRQETFGLVYAEANAVGTPVLAHEAGAASEVLSDPCQLVDGQHFPSILTKIQEWRVKRPLLKGKAAFRLALVKQSWLELLRS